MVTLGAFWGAGLPVTNEGGPVTQGVGRWVTADRGVTPAGSAIGPIIPTWQLPTRIPPGRGEQALRGAAIMTSTCLAAPRRPCNLVKRPRGIRRRQLHPPPVSLVMHASYACTVQVRTGNPAAQAPHSPEPRPCRRTLAAQSVPPSRVPTCPLSCALTPGPYCLALLSSRLHCPASTAASPCM